MVWVKGIQLLNLSKLVDFHKFLCLSPNFMTSSILKFKDSEIGSISMNSFLKPGEKFKTEGWFGDSDEITLKKQKFNPYSKKTKQLDPFNGRCSNTTLCVELVSLSQLLA